MRRYLHTSPPAACCRSVNTTVSYWVPSQSAPHTPNPPRISKAAQEHLYLCRQSTKLPPIPLKPNIFLLPHHLPLNTLSPYLCVLPSALIPGEFLKNLQHPTHTPPWSALSSSELLLSSSLPLAPSRTKDMKDMITLRRLPTPHHQMSMLSRPIASRTSLLPILSSLQNVCFPTP